MNKKLLILPVVSALLLAGCTMGRTTKKKKKSSSVDVTSQSVAPTPTSGTPAPAPTSATPGPTPTSATPTPTPTSSSGVTPVVDNWSQSEIADFNTAFHGIIPPYFSVGLNPEETNVNGGFFQSNATTEAVVTAYFATFDSSWANDVDDYGDPIKVKESSDGKGSVTCYIDYDENNNYFVGYEWYSPVVSLSLSGTYPITFEVNDTFSHEGLVVSATCKDGYVYNDVTQYVTFSEPDMTTPGQKTVTVSLEDGGQTITQSYTITVNSSVKYTVSFDAGEGSGTKPSVEASEGTYILPGASEFTAPDGKAFAGWKANNTGDLIPVGGTYTLTAAVTFYAQWSTEYTVSFSAGEGSGTMDPIKVGEGGSIVEPTCTFTAPTGKEFDKWVIGSTPVVFPYTVNSNVTLTATWKDKATPAQSVKYTIDNPADQYGKKLSDLTSEQILSGFVTSGEKVITEVKDYTNAYFGGNGGSGDTAFTIVDSFKLGKSGAKGEATVVIGSGYSFSKLVLTVVGQRDDGLLIVNGVEKSVTAKAGPGDLVTQTLEFDIASGTTDFVMSTKDVTSGNYSIYILSLEFVA